MDFDKYSRMLISPTQCRNIGKSAPYWVRIRPKELIEELESVAL
jgi:hypothetical protein